MEGNHRCGIHPCNLDPGIPCRDDDDTAEKSAAIQAAKLAFTTPSARGRKLLTTFLGFGNAKYCERILFETGQPSAPQVAQPAAGGGDGGAFFDAGFEYRLAVEGGAVAAGFGEDELAGGVIPDVLRTVEVELATPGGDPAPVEGDGADAALGGIRWFGGQPHCQRRCQTLEIDERYTFIERGFVCSRNQRSAIEFRPQAFSRGEAFVPFGVIDDAGHQLSSNNEGEGDGEDRDATAEVGGAIERVEYPAALCRLQRFYLFGIARLLTEKTELRPVVPQEFFCAFLHLCVGFGQQTSISLSRGDDVVEARQYFLAGQCDEAGFQRLPLIRVLEW